MAIYRNCNPELIQRTGKPRHNASAAVVKLRKAMKKTQQSFAVEVLQCAIGTIARWETYDPPKSDALIRLATIAHEQHLEELVEVFKQTFVDDLNAQYGLDLTRATHNGSNKKRRQ